MHLFDAKNHMLGGYGIVGGHVPLAAGVAFASKYRGDERRHALLLRRRRGAARRLPRGHLARRRCGSCRSCSSARTTSTRWARRSSARSRSPDVTERALGYGMARDASTATTCSQVKRAHRRGGRARAQATSEPTLVEVVTYRFRGHSMTDPGNYRTKDEVEEWKKRDPVPLARERLVEDSASTRTSSSSLEATSRPRSGGGAVRRASRPSRIPTTVLGTRLRRSDTDPRKTVMPRHQLSRSAQPGDERGDGARRQRLPHGRRGRPLPGRLQGLAGHAAEVRREARHRHADRRGGFAGVGVGAAMVGPAARSSSS